MEIIEDDPAARWLPSRHRFALSRLIAFAVHRKMKPARMDVDHLILAIDRGQSAAENYSIVIWFTLTTICYIAAVLPLAPAAAILAAIPLTAIAIEVPIYLGGNSTILMLLELCASIYFANMPGIVHYVAWFSLILFVMNAAAWVIDRLCGI